MPSKVIPAFKVVEAGETIQFFADGAANWQLEPNTGAGVIGVDAGTYVAPPLIIEAQTARVTAKDENGKVLGEAILQLRLPQLRVVPASIALKAAQHFQFAVEPKDYTKEVTWTLQPGSPGWLTEAGAYTSPSQVASGQEAMVTASWQKLSASSRISLLADDFSRNLLVAYWLLVISGLCWSLFCLWPKICAATREHQALRVLPALVTLQPGDKQQFHALLSGITNQTEATVTWLASRSKVSSNGLYVVPTNDPSAYTIITAISLRDPQLTTHALVNISPGAQFSIQPELTALSEGQTVQFNPRLVLAGDPLGTNTAAAGILWSLSPHDAGTLTANGFYEAPESILESRLVTVTARYSNDTRVAASALIQLAGPAHWCAGTMLLQLGLILTFGAIGSVIHAISSFVIYVGNRQFVPSWSLWYFFKPFQGALLALVIYLVAAAGLFKMETTSGLLGVCAFAVMAGLFSEQASLKLGEVADAMFGSRNDKRADKLEGAGQKATPPHIMSVTPDTIHRGKSPTPQLTISGSNFADGCIIRVNGFDRPPALTTPNELKLNLKSEDIANSGTLVLLVVNPNKQTSNEAKFIVS